MNLNDALSWLNEYEKNQEVNDDFCHITKQKIKNKMELSCGHAFEYEAIFNHLCSTQLSNHSYHKCPYCRTKHDLYIPYHESGISIDRKIRPSFFKNNYVKCEYVYKSGKKKGDTCSQSGHYFTCGQYCFQHKSIMEKRSLNNDITCIQQLKNGNPCKCKVFDMKEQLCKRHYNLKNKY
tara:strand:+ start:425 stop:961 length:537 start_codon:yes stop_codon:yes gene_type:complete